MFVKNTDRLNKDKLFSCDSALGEKLITFYKIPVLSIKDGKHYFRKTEKLLEAINELISGLEVDANGQEET